MTDNTEQREREAFEAKHSARYPDRLGRLPNGECADQARAEADALRTDGREHVTTYGVDEPNCAVAARIGDRLKYQLMQWPVPDGYKLVPLEATEAMVKAGGHANSEWLNDNAPIGESRYGGPVVKSIWKDMLNAAPKDGTEKAGNG